MDGKIKVRGSLVLIEELPKEEVTTKGGVVLPIAVTNTGVTYAKIKAVGPGRQMENGDRFDMSDLRPGDFVIIQAKRMMPIKADDQKCGVINESDILAVIDQSKGALHVAN